MLDTLLRFIGHGTPRTVLNWRRCVNIIHLKSEIFRTRTLNAGFVYNAGTNLLIKLINDGVPADILNVKSNTERWFRLEAMALKLRPVYDPVYNARQLSGLFTDDRDIPEYFLNCSTDAPILHLPIEQGWDAWKNLRPFRLLYHDSQELNLDLYRMRMPFPSIRPTRLFYALDLPMLLMMYVKYMENVMEFGEKPTPEEFIQSCLVMGWFDDLIRIWLLHIVTDMVGFQWNKYNYRSQELVMPVSNMDMLYPDVRQIVNAASVRGIPIGDICETKWFGDYGLGDWLRTLKGTVILPPLNQYISLMFITLMPYYQFILNTMRMIGRRDIETPARELLYELQMYKTRNIAAALYSPTLKNQVNHELSELIRTTKQIVYRR